MSYAEYEARERIRDDRNAWTHTFLLVSAIIGLLLWAITAEAQIAAPTDAPTDLLANVMQAISAAQAHHWLIVVGLALGVVIATALSHRLGIAKAWPWLGTDAGAAVWTFVLASLGVLATTFTAGQTPGWATVSAAIGVGVTAIGGYTGARKILGTHGGLGAKWPIFATIADFLGPAQVPQSCPLPAPTEPIAPQG